MRPITRGFVAHSIDSSEKNPQEMKAQIEVLRKMLLAMVEDIRVVLLRLASRTQTLRHFASEPDELRVPVARETLALYSPLANRLGVWELKWELEDRSFRFLHPAIYKEIARHLDEKRIERERFISEAVDRLRCELSNAGVGNAEIYGRPKHIYSIWNKMRKKDVGFAEVYDVRALRVIVDEVKDCYTALGVVHHIWSPIAKEFDDYIAHPKGNDYRSLHTAVHCPDGRALEVQIRTREMHSHAELGVAAHWRYKEGGSTPEDRYDEKIAWLRQLLTWRDEVADSSDWVRHYKQAAFDETVYVLTPQGRVVDLPQGSTPIDFAYRVHTDIGHRCRGAKVDGALVPLTTILCHRPAGRNHSRQARRTVARLAQSLAGLSCSHIARGSRSGNGSPAWRSRTPSPKGACGGRPRTAAHGADRAPTSTIWPPGWALPVATTSSLRWRAPS
jgi:GTP pyrophosphokinase